MDPIRQYGLGKFNTIVDSYVYQVSLDGGPDLELGSVSENGIWYGMMRHGLTIFHDNDPMLETLNDSEQELLTSSAGVIITEDSQGFVNVDYFEDMADLDKAWSRIEKDFEDNEQEETSE